MLRRSRPSWPGSASRDADLAGPGLDRRQSSRTAPILRARSAAISGGEAFAPSSRSLFAYLDADTKAVRVSVHLDTTDEQLVQADGTVPVQVDVDDATVFTHLPTPPTPTGWRARLGRLARRATRPGGGERRQGVDPQQTPTII